MAARDFGVIFDMDGVLADTARAHYASWRMVAENWGVEMTSEFFRDTFGQSNRQIVPLLLDRAVPADEFDEIDRFKEESYRHIVADQIEPVPGAVELVHELHSAGFRLAVGSSGPPENIALLLGALDIADCFDAVISGRDVGKGKPDPEVFLKAAEALGVRPENCLVVEDAPAGVAAALAGNMKCLALTTTNSAQVLQDADVIRQNLQGLALRDVARLLGAE